jgi:hypothetical protein
VRRLDFLKLGSGIGAGLLLGSCELPARPSHSPIVATARSLLVAGERLGTADDGPALSACAQRLANAGRLVGRPVVLDLEGLTYKIETSFRVQDFGDFTLGRGTSPGTLRTTTDFGPPGTDRRTRAHTIFTNGFHAAVAPRLSIIGPHSDAEPNRSSDGSLEQQCGAWFQSVLAVDFLDVDVQNVWGDFCDFGAADPRHPVDCQRANVRPGIWRRNGRVGLLAHCNGLHFEGGPRTRIERCVGDFYHVELNSDQQGAGFGGHTLSNLHVHDTKFFAHLAGMHFFHDFAVLNCSRDDGPVDVQLTTYNGNPAKRFRYEGNHWTVPEGRVLNLHDIEGVSIRHNAGPLQPNQTVAHSLDLNNCTRVIHTNNAFTLDGERISY